MQLVSEIEPQGAQRHWVWFQIINMTEDDRTALAYYGNPKIDFFQGDTVKNEWIWRHETVGRGVTSFESAAKAQAHRDKCCAEFAAAREQYQKRLKQDGFTSRRTVT